MYFLMELVGSCILEESLLTSSCLRCIQFWGPVELISFMNFLQPVSFMSYPVVCASLLTRIISTEMANEVVWLLALVLSTYAIVLVALAML